MDTDAFENESKKEEENNSIGKNITILGLTLALVSSGYYSYNLKSNLDSLNSKYVQTKNDSKFNINNLETQLESSQRELEVTKNNYSNSTEQILNDNKEILDLTNQIDDLRDFTTGLKERDSLNSKKLTEKLSKLTANYNQLEIDNNSTKAEYKSLFLEQRSKIEEISNLNSKLKNKYEIKFKKLLNSNKELENYLTLVYGSCGREITLLNKKNSNLISNYKKLNNNFNFEKDSNDDLSNKLYTCNKKLELEINKSKTKLKTNTSYLRVKQDSNVWNTTKNGMEICNGRKYDTDKLNKKFSSKDSQKIFWFLKDNNLYDKNIVQPNFLFPFNCKK